MKPSRARGLAVLFLAVNVLGVAAAQPATADDMTFRDLTRKFYKDGDGKDLAKLVGYTDPVKKVIALEYKVLLFADGKRTPVDPKTFEFKLGDRITVSIEPLNDYFVYIFHIGASGKGQFLLPLTDEDPPLAKANKPVALPDDGYFQFGEPAGEESVIVVAAEKPVTDRAMLARVLTKKPGEKDTPEEEALRKSLKATRQKVLKSVAETRKEILAQTVLWRGITADEKGVQQLVADVRKRGVKDGTFEEPTAQGTSALYMTSKDEDHLKLLVSIPLKSVEGKGAKP